MKRFLTLALIALSLSATADNHEEYKQWESILLTPDYSKLAVLSKNMANHNKKYHGEGAYRARIYNVVTGTDVGKFYWFMGPSTFAHLDKRPDDEGHGKDWAENIMPYITKMEHGEYWREMEGMSIDNVKDWKDSKIDNWGIRYFTVERGNGDNVEELFGKIKATLEKTGKVTFWSILENRFMQGQENGRHLQAVSAFTNWAELDDDWEFKKHFVELYGEEAWDPFWDMWNETFSNAWQEIQVLDRKMSGME